MDQTASLVIPTGQPVQQTLHNSANVAEQEGFSGAPDAQWQRSAQQMMLQEAVEQAARQKNGSSAAPSRPPASSSPDNGLRSASRHGLQQSQHQFCGHALQSGPAAHVSNHLTHEGTQTDQPASLSGLRMSMDDLIHAMRSRHSSTPQPKSGHAACSHTSTDKERPRLRAKPKRSTSRCRGRISNSAHCNQAHVCAWQGDLQNTPHKSVRHPSPPPFRPAGVADLNPPHQPASMQKQPKPKGLLQLYLGQPDGHGASSPTRPASNRQHPESQHGSNSQHPGGPGKPDWHGDTWHVGGGAVMTQRHLQQRQQFSSHDNEMLQQHEQSQLRAAERATNSPLLVKCGVHQAARPRSRLTARQLAQGVRDCKHKRLQAQQKAVDLEVKNQALAKKCKRQSARQQVSCIESISSWASCVLVEHSTMTSFEQ